MLRNLRPVCLLMVWETHGGGVTPQTNDTATNAYKGRVEQHGDDSTVLLPYAKVHGPLAGMAAPSSA